LPQITRNHCTSEPREGGDVETQQALDLIEIRICKAAVRCHPGVVDEHADPLVLA
jgi:hypothetical protein